MSQSSRSTLAVKSGVRNPTPYVGRSSSRAVLGIERPDPVQLTFAALVYLTLLTPFVNFPHLLYPTVTSKAFYFRILIESALPFYSYLLVTRPHLRPSPKHPVTLGLIAFTILTCISALTSISVYRSVLGDLTRMRGLFDFIHLVLFYFYVLALGRLGTRYFRYFVVSLVFIGSAVALLGVFSRYTDDSLASPDPLYSRISVTFGNPIFLASFLLVPICLTIFCLVRAQTRWWRLLYGCLALIEVWCLVLTQTRGALVALFVAVCIAMVSYAALSGKKLLRVCIAAGLIALIVIAGVTWSYKGDFVHNAIVSRMLNLSDASAKVRLIVWRTALQAFKAHPILGSGPETFYYVDSKYYDPAAYVYDSAWFDKPHNQLLERLVTIGCLGTVSYLSLIGALLWSVFIAWRAGHIRLSAACALLGGIVAYEVQDFFVFETPAASLTYAALWGIVACLCGEPRDSRQTSVVETSPRKFGRLTFFGSVALVAVPFYLVNLGGLWLARDIWYGSQNGFALKGQAAERFFESAAALPLNVDPVEFATKYSDFATRFALSGVDDRLGLRVLNSATAAGENAVRRVAQHPFLWQSLSALYLTQARLTGRRIFLDKAEAAINTARQLAPTRPEPAMLLVRLKLYQNDRNSAEELLRRIVRDFPSNTDAMMQAALVARDSGRVDEAINLAGLAVQRGFTPRQGQEVEWLAPYYELRGQLQAAEWIYKLAIKAEPTNFRYRLQLAQVYYLMGSKVGAIQAAQQVLTFDPAKSPEVAAMISSFK